ncbi:hypothetical protein DFH06DRAFT_1175548 [Mycena polygramma]|nr:hypothetical protein DFH06DRAFT_1175548 [Mycena polygramma]
MDGSLGAAGLSGFPCQQDTALEVYNGVGETWIPQLCSPHSLFGAGCLEVRLYSQVDFLLQDTIFDELRITSSIIMLFSTSNTILLTALVLNAASTFGAPIPYGKGNPESVTRRASSSGSDHESRYLDILVPKKRLNKMRRAARENALKALRSAEVHIARLAQVEDNLDLRELEDDDVLVGRSHASSGASGASGVDAIQELLQQVEQQVNNLLSPSGGMCSCSMQSQCPNPGIPQPCGPGAAPCPGQPGSGGSGPGSGSDPGSGGTDNSTSTEDPGLPTGLPGGGGLNATSTADPSLPTDIGGGGSGIGGGGTTTDPSLNSTETGIPGGDGGDGGASPTDSSDGSIPTGISGIGNDTSSDDGTGGGASATGLPGAGNSTSSDDGGDAGSLASATDSSDGSSATAPAGSSAGSAGDAPVGRSLFERWLSGRAPAPREPVRRVNSARFRLP